MFFNKKKNEFWLSYRKGTRARRAGPTNVLSKPNFERSNSSELAPEGRNVRGCISCVFAGDSRLVPLDNIFYLFFLIVFF